MSDASTSAGSSSDGPTADTTTALAVVLDCSEGWSGESFDDFGRVLDQMLMFLNAFHLTAANNQLLLLAAHSAGVLCLWPPPEAGADAVAAPVNPCRLRELVLVGVQSLFEPFVLPDRMLGRGSCWRTRWARSTRRWSRTW